MPDVTSFFASTEEESLSRYKQYKSMDPFPLIPPALLSSAQIQVYIAKVGLVFPYLPEIDPKKDDRVTSASFTMTIGPEVLFWDSEGAQQYLTELKTCDSITLRPNSITFLRPAERFNMPDYIAARFNLRIVHVHRGLLLGTGPLMDPGFTGYPMIPVHNLTENEYTVRVGDEFINVEFTKINIDVKCQMTDTDNNVVNIEYMTNKGKTCDFSFTRYIDKNVWQRKVKSSLSTAIDKATEVTKQVEERLKRFTLGGIIAISLTIVALVYGGYELTMSAISITNAAREKVDRNETAMGIFNDQQSRIDIQKKQQIELEQLRNTVQRLEHEIEGLRSNGTTRPIRH
ncbi:MAG: hypothetical protein P4L55_12880 [Syntrophobacteraceae bacterium]|nr:hypothetical protein [Syntrophobacteraceae bacterium]